jgi:hypothetical protein
MVVTLAFVVAGKFYKPGSLSHGELLLSHLHFPIRPSHSRWLEALSRFEQIKTPPAPFEFHFHETQRQGAFVAEPLMYQKPDTNQRTM